MVRRKTGQEPKKSALLGRQNWLFLFSLTEYRLVVAEIRFNLVVGTLVDS